MTDAEISKLNQLKEEIKHRLIEVAKILGTPEIEVEVISTVTNPKTGIIECEKKIRDVMFITKKYY